MLDEGREGRVVVERGMRAGLVVKDVESQCARHVDFRRVAENGSVDSEDH